MSQLNSGSNRRVYTEIAAQLCDHLSPAKTPLLLGVQPAQVDRWRRGGMPVEYVGSSPRFSPDACRAGFAERAAPRSTPRAGTKPDEPIPGVRRANGGSAD